MKQTASPVSQITLANRQLAAPASQMTHAVKQLNEVTQQNTSASEQVWSTAKELAVKAGALRGFTAFSGLARDITTRASRRQR